MANVKITKSGSIEQHLDMAEDGSLRGDEVLHHHGQVPPAPRSDRDPVPLDRVMNDNYRTDMAEEDREGDDLSGDDHSSGLQGGEEEVEHQLHIVGSDPGDLQEEEDEEFDEEEKRGA